MTRLQNPLLAGFYPDPTICRRGDDYYMVTSSFEYFPGIPVFHSKDFIHWHQIGHVLTREQQADLRGLNPSRGIFASTIRYHEASGRFYVVTTLVGNAPYKDNVNFYVWADSPSGPWSDPIPVRGAEGIDPTLFFDGEKTYYLGNMRPYPEDPACEARYIWLQELELETGTLIGQRRILLKDGAFHNAVAPEGPHMYHIGDWYYLMIAEGGTDHNHAVTVFRSRSVWGPYESNPRNPVITHRHLRRDYPINSVGHADLIQLADNSWWAVLLASRPDGGDYRNLGRETFAVPVIWENEWPVFSPETGKVEFTYPAPVLPVQEWEALPACDDFDAFTLLPVWNTLRTSAEDAYSLTERPGFLRLFFDGACLSDIASPAFVGRRQQHMDFTASAMLAIHSGNPVCAAGIALFYNNENYYTALIRPEGSGAFLLQLTCCSGGKLSVLAAAPYAQSEVYFQAEVRQQDICFYFSSDNENWTMLGETVTGTILNKENGGGFTGTYVGLYATSKGGESDRAHEWADFDWFRYLPEENG